MKVSVQFTGAPLGCLAREVSEVYLRETTGLQTNRITDLDFLTSSDTQIRAWGREF